MDSVSNFIFSEYNTVYLYSIFLMFGFFLLELISMLAGMHLSGMIDDLFPDITPDADIDADVDMDLPDASLPFHHAVLHWFNIGKVPFLVLVVLFLTIFGLTGFLMQLILLKSTGSFTTQYILIPVNLIVSFYLLHITGGAIGRLIPSEESSAVSQESFIGRVAVITTGTSKKGMPAQAKLKDEHGRYHYIMTEPLNEGDEFSKGVQVVVVDKEGRNYLVDEFNI